MTLVNIFAAGLLAASTIAGVAQQPTSLGTATNNKPVYYDIFKGPWIDGTKWFLAGPGCQQYQTLECIREIQQGRLRLEVRTVGQTDKDSGFQFSASDLAFVNPNLISSIKTDVTVNRAMIVGCSTNFDYARGMVTKIQGNFFNTGSNLPEDDVSDEVHLRVEANNPAVVYVANWMTGAGLGVTTEIGSYPIGTPLTVTNAWDKENHRFISVVQEAGKPETSRTVTVGYTVSDQAEPVATVKGFFVYSFSPNCTSAQTTAAAEAFFDNVQINVPLPPETK